MMVPNTKTKLINDIEDNSAAVHEILVNATN